MVTPHTPTDRDWPSGTDPVDIIYGDEQGNVEDDIFFGGAESDTILGCGCDDCIHGDDDTSPIDMTGVRVDQFR